VSKDVVETDDTARLNRQSDYYLYYLLSIFTYGGHSQVWIWEFSKRGRARGSGEWSHNGIKGQSPSRKSGDEVPQKLKRNVKLVNHF